MTVSVRTSSTLTSFALRSSRAASASSRSRSVLSGFSVMLLVSIELGGAQIILHRLGKQITRAHSGAHQGTDAGSRDVELGNAMKQEAAGRARAQIGDLIHASSRHQRREFARRRRGAARPLHHDKVTEVHQLPPAAPRRESVQGVHADDERKRSIAQLLPQRKHGIYHVRVVWLVLLVFVVALVFFVAVRVVLFCL